MRRQDDNQLHAERIGALAGLIGERIGLRGARLVDLCRAAPLHDIGKATIPAEIINKPGPLTAEEFEIVKTHTTAGAEILAGSRSPVLEMAGEIALTHHERWDGAGYPQGLAGEEIPLVGRIVAVADVLDALANERPYKAAWPLADAVAEIARGSGSHFDPLVATALCALYDEGALDVLGLGELSSAAV